MQADLLTWIWILIWGVVPPVVTGYFAYRMGRQGRDQAFALRDQALAQVDELRRVLRELDSKIEKLEGRVSDNIRASSNVLGTEIKAAVADMDSKIQSNLRELGDRDLIVPIVTALEKKLPKVPTVDEIVAAIKIPEIPKVPTASEISAEIKIPVATMDELRDTINKTVSGAWGNIVKKYVGDVDKELNTEAEVEAAKVSVGEKIKVKLLNRVMDLIG